MLIYTCFQCSNIIFAATKNQPSSEGGTSASQVTDTEKYTSSDVYTLTTVTVVECECLIYTSVVLCRVKMVRTVIKNVMLFLFFMNIGSNICMNFFFYFSGS